MIFLFALFLNTIFVFKDFQLRNSIGQVRSACVFTWLDKIKEISNSEAQHLPQRQPLMKEEAFGTTY